MKAPDRVERVQRGRVHVLCHSGSKKKVLRDLGARRTLLPWKWRIGFAGRGELAVVMSALRDADLAFEGGPGWPPSAVFQDLRDAGLVHGTCLEVVWTGPGQPVVREV
jgi:hypothetical protein